MCMCPRATGRHRTGQWMWSTRASGSHGCVRGVVWLVMKNEKLSMMLQACLVVGLVSASMCGLVLGLCGLPRDSCMSCTHMAYVAHRV